MLGLFSLNGFAYCVDCVCWLVMGVGGLLLLLGNRLFYYSCWLLLLVDVSEFCVWVLLLWVGCFGRLFCVCFGVILGLGGVWWLLVVGFDAVGWEMVELWFGFVWVDLVVGVDWDLVWVWMGLVILGVVGGNLVGILRFWGLGGVGII